MNPQRKMVYMQRIFNPSQYRSNGLSTLNKENFVRVMIESINKAINSAESPAKEKHVRKLLIGSYQAESGLFFWEHLPVIRLKENQIVCWKFCHVLHRMLRDGHRQVLMSSYERRKILLDCGNMWRHVEDGYGQLIWRYCTLLYNRINFLMRHSRFPNDLKVSDEQLDEIGERDVSVFFDLSCEIFDALDDILKLQELVLATLDLKKLSSITGAGQCHLAPLVACIQDSSLLYDYSVKILFKLHGTLTASTLEGHRDRFLGQHKALKSFYINTSSLQYFKTLIQIPHLSNRAPNFLIASDLQQHITPQVVMIGDVAESESPDQFSRQSQGNGQLLVNLSDDPHPEDLESNFSQSIPDTSASNDDSIDTMLNQPNLFQEDEQQGQISRYLEKIGELSNQIHDLEASVTALKGELEAEKANHSTTKELLMSDLAQVRADHDEQIKARDADLKKLKDEVNNFKYQIRASNNALEKVQDECKRAKHDNEISQGALKKLAKDLSELKTENSNLRESSSVTVQSKPDQDLVDELDKKINELKAQLANRDKELMELRQETEALMSSKEKLEQQLESNQEDLLVSEMNETDKIIREATKKIEELCEKSHTTLSQKLGTGVKLQVNVKISKVCSNLMMAVRNLIVQSRLLQHEVVGGDAQTNSAEFYKRNSSWTEGLISAANVVAMAARSLVDAADRTLSGQARFSELAAAAHEVDAATAQLVVASRVKANKDSEKLKILEGAAKQVKQCTGQVVDTARLCAELIEQEIDEVDISSLSLHQTKKLEMETQAKLYELEVQLSKERIKLGLLRRQHYEHEASQTPSNLTTT